MSDQGGSREYKEAQFSYSVLTYCYCRMPETFSEDMIMCNKCQKWFHLGVCIPKEEKEMVLQRLQTIDITESFLYNCFIYVLSMVIIILRVCVQIIV